MSSRKPNKNDVKTSFDCFSSALLVKGTPDEYSCLFLLALVIQTSQIDHLHLLQSQTLLDIIFKLSETDVSSKENIQTMIIYVANILCLQYYYIVTFDSKQQSSLTESASSSTFIVPLLSIVWCTSLFHFCSLLIFHLSNRCLAANIRTYFSFHLLLHQV